MARNLRTIVLVGTILLPILAAAGCTGTDVITAGNGTVTFQAGVTNAVNAARFEGIFFTLNQVALRPLDPNADAALGPKNLALVQTDLVFNLAGDLSGFGSPDVPIPAGSYVVERLEIEAIRATDVDGTGSPASCAEYVASFPPTSGLIVYQDGAELNVVVEIDANTSNVVRLTIDVDEFLKALASAWACRSSNCPGGAAWCLGTSFRSTRFKLFTDNYFSFD